MKTIYIAGFLEFKVSLEASEASQRNKLDTKDKTYKLVLDAHNYQISLEKQNKQKMQETLLSWPLPYIRRYNPHLSELHLSKNSPSEQIFQSPEQILI